MIENLKKEAAVKAVEQVKSGMLVGLGTGSTTKYAIEEIARKINSGELEKITGIPTSNQTHEIATNLNITLTEFLPGMKIDITIDGADEVDENFNLIKGGGGALLREKIVAEATEKEIIIVDESKLSQTLGDKWHVPVEVIPFAKNPVQEYLESIGAIVNLRKNKNGEDFITDEKNIILDSIFGLIFQPEFLNLKLNSKAGIVEHGLFVDIASEIIVASKEGIRILNKN